VRAQRVSDDISAIRDEVAIPGLGALPINAFVFHAEQPVLVDTGRPMAQQEFMDTLGTIIDPKDIRYVWLSHPDRDHMGSLFRILDEAPNARLVSTFLAVGYLTVEFDMPLDRVFLLNPGQALDVGGGRNLHAFRPPTFDSPMTVGFYDDATGTCFSSDCFGAPLPDIESAAADDLNDVKPDDVRGGQLTWVTADSPWVRNVDRNKFAASYDEFRRLAPERILSTHLPPAYGQLGTLLEMLEEAPDAAPFVGPDQAQLEALLASMPPPTH